MSLVPEAARTRTVGHLILQQQRIDLTPRIVLIPHTDLIRLALSEILTDESNAIHLRSMNLCERPGTRTAGPAMSSIM
jgi:hypothetical protein